ncbi:hypothetical protein [Paraliomyxa miuraensis]|uniref:hypothetical protein n=1 Tax=Paraliomyxa miuraensis TaxID=376150 RepID=UPI00225BDBF1|nr:hypothetical protein [Paraliomyxa miuraensis]MCX4248074.1 hypothetical protein [Paraliomyxa miuraensis]
MTIRARLLRATLSPRSDSGMGSVMGLAAGGLVAGVLAGCLYHEEDFVAEYAVEVCRMVRECGRELHLPGESELLPATSACEGMIEAHYSTCISGCNYRPAKARRCLRRLRDNECEGEVVTADPDDDHDGDETIPLVCDFVFNECEGGDDQEIQCMSPNGCAVGERPGEGWLLGLGLLGLWWVGRRRARGA